MKPTAKWIEIEYSDSKLGVYEVRPGVCRVQVSALGAFLQVIDTSIITQMVSDNPDEVEVLHIPSKGTIDTISVELYTDIVCAYAKQGNVRCRSLVDDMVQQVINDNKKRVSRR